ncbi:hypothetical protein NEOLI_004439 [Neolecta irregularis DAH-3]|uniref:Uncharacterized protein n=1 Tax=Neolecta irregularis (strain DAH-3) TaxID=1198029 RepID=A0A1U7LLT7_NEOID|nr:hypothetical protein NEOLI_004439 [Neolecta irregularis DAH-3]|eukprot:OLL23598.1 hypothetical protein NEOLI_004439 [Neolecta irregularis DAH-3]
MLALLFASAVAAAQFTEIFNGMLSSMSLEPSFITTDRSRDLPSCEQSCIDALFTCQSYAFVGTDDNMFGCFLYKKPLRAEEILVGSQDIQAVVKVLDPLSLMLPRLSTLISDQDIVGWSQSVSKQYHISLSSFPFLRSLIFTIPNEEFYSDIDRSKLVSDIKSLLAMDNQSTYETLVKAYLTLAREALHGEMRVVSPVYLDGLWTIYSVGRSDGYDIEAVISIGGDELSEEGKEKIISHFGDGPLRFHLAGFRDEEINRSSVALDDALTVVNLINNIFIYKDDIQNYDLFSHRNLVQDVVLAALSMHWNIKNEEVVYKL